MQVRLGKETKKRSAFDLSHDVSTTTQFGHCQPIMCVEVPADSSVHLRTGSFVRLQPLQKPTFGSAELKTYSSFVRIADLYHPFENLLSGRPYSGAGVDYVPTEVPSVTPHSLKALVMRSSTINVYKIQNASYSQYNPVSFESSVYISTPDINTRSLETLNMALAESFSDDLMDSIAQSFTFFNFDKDDSLTFESCDFSWLFYGADSNPYIALCRLSQFGRDLRKVLIGLGYQMSNSKIPVSALPLFAYYKVYFDCLAPKRYKNWNNTNAFKVMEYFEQNNKNFKNCTSAISDRICDFFSELADTYYYQGSDFISAHIEGGSIDATPLTEVSAMGSDGSIRGVFSSNGKLPGIQTNPPSASNVSAVTLRVIQLLEKYVNKNTALGGKIDEFMKVHFGSIYVNNHDSNFLGVTDTPINITDVMSTSDTASASGGSVLGEYAGQGIGKNAGENFNFECNATGYLISFQCVVPRARMSQGIDPNLYHIGRFDFFTPQFDAVTLKPNSANIAFSSSDFDEHPDEEYDNYDSGFGNIPLYSEYKVHGNILNGDMSLGSTRASYLPFTLDKLLPYDQYVKDGNGYKMFVMRPDLVVASTYWRTIGKFPWLGNYDRIFVNEGQAYDSQPKDNYHPKDDNFIVHNFIDLKINAPMLPLSDSFVTDSFDDYAITTQKE